MFFDQLIVDNLLERLRRANSKRIINALKKELEVEEAYKMEQLRIQEATSEEPPTKKLKIGREFKKISDTNDNEGSDVKKAPLEATSEEPPTKKFKSDGDFKKKVDPKDNEESKFKKTPLGAIVIKEEKVEDLLGAVTK